MADEPEDGAEEEPVASWTQPTKGPDREDMVASYLPEADEWEAKTILERNDPGAVAALSQFGRLFPEVEDLQPVIDEFLFEFMRSRTSVGGQSRQDFRDVFMAMYGGNPEGSRPGEQLARALAGDLYDD